MKLIVYEMIMEKFSNLAKLIVTDGRTLMTAEDLNIIYFSAIALILVFLTVRIATKRQKNDKNYVEQRIG